MQNYESLYLFSASLHQAWRQTGAADLDKAAKLVERLKSVEQDLLEQLPEVTKIIRYAESQTHWDNDTVMTWPMTVMDALEDLDKQYAYRPDGDNWEVYSLSYTGDEEWKATVETETLANNIVAMLTPNYINPISQGQ